MVQAVMVCRHQSKSCLHAHEDGPMIVSLQLQRERIARQVRSDIDQWRSRSMNSANYKTEYERRDLRVSFITEIIACVCINSFPRVFFQNSFPRDNWP